MIIQKNVSSTPVFPKRYVIVVLLCSPLSLAASESPIGKTLLAQGAVSAEGQQAKRELKRQDPVFQQDIIRTGGNAFAQLRMMDNAYLSLQENTVLRLVEYQPKTDIAADGEVTMDLLSGGLRTITGAFGKKDKADYQLNTPLATIGIRGTKYEVVLVPGGMHVAVWEGKVKVSARNGKCEATLGDGQDFQYIYISKQGDCQPQKQVPKNFQDGHRPSVRSEDETRDGSELSEDGQSRIVSTPTPTPDPPLPLNAFILGQQNPVLPAAGRVAPLASGIGSISIKSGRANALDVANPSIQAGGKLLTTSSGQANSFQQNIGGYPVSWGKWDSYDMQDNLASPKSPSGDADGLIWSAYQPSAPDVVGAKTGTVYYGNTVGYLAESTGGDVGYLSATMNVNFDAATVENGRIFVRDTTQVWDGRFNGQIENGDLSLNFQNGTVSPIVSGATDGGGSPVTGFIDGDFVGDNANAVTGAFGMIDDTDANNQVQGIFLVDDHLRGD
ncbi:FecR family protein [Thiothrix unzii]|uniref:FecR domain-containing protein n=1 Tax=Thiothrix unzii TaxID=111769 RepID=A0A975F8Z2_9GAMM|nr:FecR family protein [Thiothrix unzii]QTR53221.1 FecR domain-containing protein [Thiothrix unzii]